MCQNKSHYDDDDEEYSAIYVDETKTEERAVDEN